MTARIDRVVDAHIHLWDPASTEWYPYLSGLRDVGIGDLDRWARYFDQKTYFAEAANWNVVEIRPCRRGDGLRGRDHGEGR